MKALLVEDDYFYAARIREFLADRGIEVSVARSVQDALKMDLKDFGAILVDIGLPNDPSESGISSEETRAGFMSGVALCRELRKRGNKLPIILLSSELVGGDLQGVIWIDISKGVKAVGEDIRKEISHILR